MLLIVIILVPCVKPCLTPEKAGSSLPMYLGGATQGAHIPRNLGFQNFSKVKIAVRPMFKSLPA